MLAVHLELQLGEYPMGVGLALGLGELPVAISVEQRQDLRRDEHAWRQVQLQ
jgi:hypothetical protein